MTFPRLLGGLVVLWALYVAWTPDEPRWVWPLLACVWLVPAAMLIRGGKVRMAAVIIACLSMGGFLWGGGGDDFFFWLAVILFVSEGRPNERALLLRVMVSVVYGFAALTKLNPVWLAGDQLVKLTDRSGYLEAFLPVFASSWGRVLAVLVVALEAYLAVGLWFRRTRGPTALVGVWTHVVLTAVAAAEPIGILNLVPLNFGLVVMYLAFWYPLRDGAAWVPVTVFDRRLAWVDSLARA